MPRGIKARNKHQKLCRLHPDQIIKLELKLETDNITYQKFSEVVIKAYMRNNKEIMRLVKNFVEEKGTKKKTALNEYEKDELSRIIEEQYSPMKEFGELNEALGDLEDE